jgi:hypothetical protein
VEGKAEFDEWKLRQNTKQASEQPINKMAS